MEEFVVCAEQDLIIGRGKKVVIDGAEIALFTVDGKVYAISNMCPHQKFQKLHDGKFENGIVTCPMHGWAYDVLTGKSTNADGRVKVYETAVNNGKVIVKM